MNSKKVEGEAVTRLRTVRHGLLRLHRSLMDAERILYEQAHGQVSKGELLQLLINHEQFAWLHAISEAIVSIDEMMDQDEPITEEAVESMIKRIRALLMPSETGSEFERRYAAAMQREPSAVLAHGEVIRLLKQ